MTRKLAILLGLVFIAVAGAAMAWWHYSGRGNEPTPVFENPLSRVEAMKNQIDVAMRDYVPQPVPLEDMTAPIDLILRQHPCVRAIDRGGPPNPKRRVIHLRDWHLVSKEGFKIDIEQDGKKTYTAEEIERYYRDHIVEVEMTQLAQMAVLRTLIKHHGLRDVHSEGLARGEEGAYADRIDWLRGIAKQADDLQRQLDEVREIGKTAAGKQKSDALKLEAEVTTALFGLKPLLLDIGATGRLLLSGELVHVLPLENAKAIHDANPIKNGKWQPDKALTDKRLAEMARILRTHDSPVSVIVLGASHDLRPHLLEDAKYLRVTMRSLRFFQ